MLEDASYPFLRPPARSPRATATFCPGHLVRKIRLRHRFHRHSLQPGSILPASILLYSILASAVLLVTGCGGSGSPAKTTAPLSIAPTITTQPASQTMLLGRSATFTVAATGTAPLFYQWYRNGVAVSNGNATTFLTPVVTAADNNTTYSVTVTNSAGSVQSAVATLQTGPRAPMLGDLRYLQWEQVPLLSEIGNQYGGVGTEIDGDTVTGTGSLPDPLSIGSFAPYGGSSGNFPSCYWDAENTGIDPEVQILPLMDIFTFGTVIPALGESYAQYLQSVAIPNGVIISMDYHPSCQQIGILQLSTPLSTEPNFDQRMELVDPANLQAQVAADGAASRIVSAATYDKISGKFVLLSYGWQGDTSTAYEAKTLIAQAANVLADAEELANEGYFISACGGDDTGGYALIGMRVMGDSMPRPWYANTGTTNPGDLNHPTSGNLPTLADPAPITPVFFIEEATTNQPETIYNFSEQ